MLQQFDEWGLCKMSLFQGRRRLLRWYTFFNFPIFSIKKMSNEEERKKRVMSFTKQKSVIADEKNE
jgi:hypothetical protein